MKVSLTVRKEDEYLNKYEIKVILRNIIKSLIATEKELGEIDLTTLSVIKTQKEDGSFIESEINFAIWAFSIREKALEN